MGSLRGEQYDIADLLTVIQRLGHENVEFRAKFRLTIYGTAEPMYHSLIEELGIQEMVHLAGFVPQAAVPGKTSSADALLLFINDTQETFRHYTSAKLFNYIGARRPILALVPPDGAAAALVRERRLGIVVGPHDQDGIAQALVAMVSSHASLRESMTDSSEYASDRMIPRAAAVFDSVARGGQV
jgi:glycosyltransferase involved in cell wall biosynthesis